MDINVHTIPKTDTKQVNLVTTLKGLRTNVSISTNEDSVRFWNDNVFLSQ